MRLKNHSDSCANKSHLHTLKGKMSMIPTVTEEVQVQVQKVLGGNTLHPYMICTPLHTVSPFVADAQETVSPMIPTLSINYTTPFAMYLQYHIVQIAFLPGFGYAGTHTQFNTYNHEKIAL